MCTVWGNWKKRILCHCCSYEKKFMTLITYPHPHMVTYAQCCMAAEQRMTIVARFRLTVINHVCLWVSMCHWEKVHEIVTVWWRNLKIHQVWAYTIHVLKYTHSEGSRKPRSATEIWNTFETKSKRTIQFEIQRSVSNSWVWVTYELATITVINYFSTSINDYDTLFLNLCLLN